MVDGGMGCRRDGCARASENECMKSREQKISVSEFVWHREQNRKKRERRKQRKSWCSHVDDFLSWFGASTQKTHSWKSFLLLLLLLLRECAINYPWWSVCHFDVIWRRRRQMTEHPAILSNPKNGQSLVRWLHNSTRLIRDQEVHFWLFKKNTQRIKCKCHEIVSLQQWPTIFFEEKEEEKRWLAIRQSFLYFPFQIDRRHSNLSANKNYSTTIRTHVQPTSEYQIVCLPFNIFFKSDYVQLS